MKKEQWGIFFPLSVYRFFAAIIIFFSYSIDVKAQCAVHIPNIECTTAAPTVINNSISCTPPTNNAGRRNF